MKYHISYVRNNVPQGILVDAPSEKVADAYFRNKKPDAQVYGIHEATRDDMKPGKPVLTVPSDFVAKLLQEEASVQGASAGNPYGLPDMCYSVSLYSGELVVLKYGESGYYQCSYNTSNAEQNKSLADMMNNKLGVTPSQRAAMEIGSQFGWNSPGVNPSVHEKKSLQDKIKGAETRAAKQKQGGTDRNAPVPER